MNCNLSGYGYVKSLDGACVLGGLSMALEDLIAALTGESQTAVVVTDGDLSHPGPTILYVNQAFERMTGYGSAELVGRSPRLLQGEKTSLATRRALARALREGKRMKVALINYRKSGEPYRCEVEVFPILDKGGALVNAVALEREVRRRPGRRPSTATAS
jgi:PAS domain S-box-containing protein